MSCVLIVNVIYDKYQKKSCHLMVTGDHSASCSTTTSCHPFWEEITSWDWGWNPSWKSSLWRWLCSSTTIVPLWLHPRVVTTWSFDSFRKQSLTDEFFCVLHEFWLLFRYISYVWGRGGTCLMSSATLLHGCSDKSSLKMSNVMCECIFFLKDVSQAQQASWSLLSLHSSRHCVAPTDLPSLCDCFWGPAFLFPCSLGYWSYGNRFWPALHTTSPTGCNSEAW